MFCVVCDDDMTLMKVDRDEIMKLLGFEHHAFWCSNCRNLKWQPVFIRHGREILPVDAAPSIAPAITGRDERIDLLRRLAARMRNWKPTASAAP
jgi:hypothetical protein